MKKNKNGFTLVELLAVIVILAIIMIIAIPSVLQALNNARKDTFYTYANKIYQEAVKKYTQDAESDEFKIACNVYDITEDLDLTDTGNFDGWAKVKRVQSSSGAREAVIEIKTSAKELQTIRYCVGKGDKCTPNKSKYVQDGVKKFTVKETIDEGQVMCVSAQEPNAQGKLVPVSIANPCVKWENASLKNDMYTYEVTIALTNKTYSIQDFVMTEGSSKEEVFKAMDDFSKTHSTLEIQKPGCTDDDTGTKGTTTTNITGVSSTNISDKSTTNVNDTTITTKTTIVTSSGQTQQSTTELTGPTVSTRSTEYITKPGETTTKITNVNTTLPYSTSVITITSPNGGTQGTSYIIVTKPGEQITINPGTSIMSNVKSTTYIDVIHHTTMAPELMLSSLTVEGYDIEFNPAIYHYQIEVPNNVTELKVSATTMSPNTKYFITGQTGFNVGDNVIIVEVYDELTNKKGYYRIIVKRFDENGQPLTQTKKTKPNGTEWDPNSNDPDPSIKASNVNLRSIKIGGYDLEFSPEVTEYTLEIRGDKSLKIMALPEENGAFVQIEGNEDLKNNSEITIKVRSKNNFYTKDYKIKVKQKKEDTTTQKTFKAIAIGLIGLLLLATLIMTITKKNRTRKDYEGEVDATSGPGTQTYGQEGQTLPETPQAPVPGQPEQQMPVAPQGQVQNPVPGVPGQPIPQPPMPPQPGAPGQVAMPQAPGVPGGQIQTPIPPQPQQQVPVPPGPVPPQQ